MRQDWNTLSPLDRFYVPAGRSLPSFEQVPGDAVPEPFRRLLVGCHDMTPTLESFHADRLHLQLLERSRGEHTLARLVVLKRDRDCRPVEFGAIVIHLEHLGGEPRRLVLEGHCPFGRVLADHDVAHYGCPQGFFRVFPDALISSALEMTVPQPLYGRRNLLLTPQESLLAEVVEILPPHGEDREFSGEQ